MVIPEIYRILKNIGKINFRNNNPRCFERIVNAKVSVGKEKREIIIKIGDDEGRYRPIIQISLFASFPPFLFPLELFD